MPQQIDEMQTRADRKISSFDAEARTVDIVLATESEVRRRSWEEGLYIEILNVNKAAIDTTRLDALALVDQHDVYTGLSARLGSVMAGSLRFEGGKAIVTAKLSRNAGGEALFRDLEDGHVLGASVGYRIDAFEKTEAPAGGLPTIRATRWTPLELSIVSIPADPAATTRALKHEKETEMPQTIENERQEQQQRQAPTNVITERTRISELRSIARLAAVGEDELTRAIDDGTTAASFRATALEAMAARQEQAPTFPHTAVRDGGNAYQQEIELRQEAIAARMMGRTPEGNARQFMSASLLDHARGLLEAQGIDTRSLNREQILGYRGRSMGMHTTSDFPLLLQGAGDRVLQAAYQLAQSPLKTVLSRRSSANDFRAKSSLKISDAGLLTKVNESGEIKSTTRAETAESYKIETYGRIFALSFQAIVNDDLGAFTDWSVQAGRMAALTENKILLDLLIAGSGAGPLMGEDNKRLFHADHKNLAAVGTALDEANLGNGILAFRKQTTLGGQRTNLAPRYILTGPELELTAQKLVASISPTSTRDAVPEAIKNLVPVVEPNLDGKSWYLFGDPAAAPVLEWSYLSGYEGPQIDSRDGFERLGTEFRAVLHFGGGAVDFRGAYRNPGVTE